MFIMIVGSNGSGHYPGEDTGMQAVVWEWKLLDSSGCNIVLIENLNYYLSLEKIHEQFLSLRILRKMNVTDELLLSTEEG